MACCIVAACRAARISSGCAGDGPCQARIDLLTAKTRKVYSRTRTVDSTLSNLKVAFPSLGAKKTMVDQGIGGGSGITGVALENCFLATRCSVSKIPCPWPILGLPGH